MKNPTGFDPVGFILLYEFNAESNAEFQMRRFIFFLITIWILTGSIAAHAEMNFIMWGAPAEIRLRVGAAVGVTTVTHDVPVANIGDGTPIPGTPNSVLIEASARRTSFFEAIFTNFTISVDSSIPLSSGSNTIPFTDISWTAQDGDIPSGSFTGSPAQVILGPTRTIWQVRDWHTFYYNNVRVVPSGTYTGRVTYTAAIP